MHIIKRAQTSCGAYMHTHASFCMHYLYTGCQWGRDQWDEDVSMIPTSWDSDVVRLWGAASVGDVGTLPLESVISNVRLSLAGFSHFVTRNLKGEIKATYISNVFAD